MFVKPRYISVDDFNNYWNRDLAAMLRGGSNPSDEPDSFLARVEDRLMAWIDRNSFRRVRYDKLTPYQLDQFKRAILTQAMYVYRNGQIGLDSGYDPEKGKIISQDELAAIEVCQGAIDFLLNAGIFNLVMKNRPRVNRGIPGFTGNIDFDD